MADEFCLKIPDFHVTFRDLLHAVNLRHGTNGFTSLTKEGVLRIFFTLKNPTASAGYEPANLGTEGQHATSRPPNPLFYHIRVVCTFINRCRNLVFLAIRRNRSSCGRCDKVGSDMNHDICAFIPFNPAIQ